MAEKQIVENYTTKIAATNADLDAKLGIDVDRLGCVMLDVDDPGIAQLLPASVWAEPPATDWHITLLYGLLKPEIDLVGMVGMALDHWVPPLEVATIGYDMFGAAEDVLVLLLNDQRLYTAHGLLSRLPHVNTWPHYRPHITIGRVQPGLGPLVIQHLRKDFTPPIITCRRISYEPAGGDR